MQKGKVYRKDSSWWFRFKTPVIRNGKRVWKDRYARLARADEFDSVAQVKKSGLLAQYRNDLDTLQMTPSMMQTVNAFVENTYFPRKKETLKPSTLIGYKDFFRRNLKPAFEGLRMHEMRLHIAQQILDGIAKDNPHLSPGAIKHLKWLGVAIFEFAAQQGAFNPDARNPFSNVAIPKTQHKSQPTRHATLEDVVAMIGVLDEPAATVVAVAAFSGLRKSELQGLRWEDLKDGVLHVRRTAWRTTSVSETTKTEASQAPVPVIPVLAKYLATHRNGAPADGFIFAGPKMGKPLDLHNLANRVIRPALKNADIPWCGWHGFRRGLATTLYELGTEARTRQAILRHANVAVTEKHYTKSVNAVSLAAMRKVQKAFNAKIKKARRSRH
ncbi:MAG TPA: tyrosine-type recombinase/integrase [Candidatus Acidoferrales bacterium]|nr:tyrosine-type recombinase/integrase [Candidatus Acidoferrales bacterium]